MLVPFAAFIEGQTELLDGGDDDFLGIVLGQQSTNQRGGIGVFLDAAFLEADELLASPPIEILAVDDKGAFVDVVVLFEERRGLEGGQGFATTGGVPDVAVAAVVLDALDDLLDGVDLVGAHHHQLLLALDQDHVAADGSAQSALG